MVPVHVARTLAGPTYGDEEASLEVMFLEHGKCIFVVGDVSVIEGDFGAQAAVYGLLKLSVEFNLSLEVLAGHHVGVSALTRSKLVVEEIEAVQGGSWTDQS
jgi:hypothetical protein